MIRYNTQRKRLPLPEYGRNIQNMVNHALTLKDRRERQRCANAIVKVMAWMTPHLRGQPDYQRKLWDNLAVMADFKLDIDYPFDIIPQEQLKSRPEHIAYPQGGIRYRHYGRILETLIRRACELPEGEEKDNLVAMICNHLRKDYVTWNRDVMGNDKLADDLYELSGGRLALTSELLDLMDYRVEVNYRRPAKRAAQQRPQNAQQKQQYAQQRQQYPQQRQQYPQQRPQNAQQRPQNAQQRPQSAQRGKKQQQRGKK